jgi:hypothetical protein
MECAHTSDVVNLVWTGVSLLEIISTMNAMAGYEMRICKNQQFVRNNEVKTMTGSNRKLFSFIGEQKMFSIEDTLRWMFGPA